MTELDILLMDEDAIIRSLQYPEADWTVKAFLYAWGRYPSLLEDLQWVMVPAASKRIIKLAARRSGYIIHWEHAQYAYGCWYAVGIQRRDNG